MRPSILRLAALCLLLAGTTAQAADELLMVRSDRPFPETMNSLQEAIQRHGYTVSRVQRVDIGLTLSGFQTAEYRIVFFGKAPEIQELSRKHPELIPYLPLNIVIFAEGEETLILTTNPQNMARFFTDSGLDERFTGWARDIRQIFNEVTGSAP